MTLTTSRLAESPLYAVLPATDISRAARFYGETLGLHTETPSHGNLMVHAGKDTSFLVYETTAPHGEATAASFMVSDIVSAVEELRGRGITFEEYDLPGLKTVDGVVDMGPMGKGAWFKDSEGNILNLAQM